MNAAPSTCNRQWPSFHLARLRLYAVAFLLIVSYVVPALAQTNSPVRVDASPYRVYEGDAVRFIYMDRTNGVPVPGVSPRANILSRQWVGGRGGADRSGGERCQEGKDFPLVPAEDQDDPFHRPKSSVCALLVDRSVYFPQPIAQTSRTRSPRLTPSAGGGAGWPSSRMVNSAWALGGSSSVPAVCTWPLSRSTSSVL